MDEQNQPPPDRPQYRWPKYAILLLLLFIALAVIWMVAEVRRQREARSESPLFPTTNSAAPPQ